MRRILIVDDNPLILAMLSDAFAGDYQGKLPPRRVSSKMCLGGAHRTSEDLLVLLGKLARHRRRPRPHRVEPRQGDHRHSDPVGLAALRPEFSFALRQCV